MEIEMLLVLKQVSRYYRFTNGGMTQIVETGIVIMADDGDDFSKPARPTGITWQRFWIENQKLRSFWGYTFEGRHYTSLDAVRTAFLERYPDYAGILS